jgi:hypothetical protein
MNDVSVANGRREYEGGNTLAYDAFCLALLAADAVIAWHSGSIDADTAMTGLHLAFAGLRQEPAEAIHP